MNDRCPRVNSRTARLAIGAAVIILATVLAIGWFFQPAEAQGLPARCNDNGDYGYFLEQDTIWDKDVYLGQDLTVRKNKNPSINSYTTLTITAGTKVYFCGDYSLIIGGLFSPARLVVLGEQTNPVVFEPAQGASRWGSLIFGDPGNESSRMKYVVLRKGGGPDPAAAKATVEISDRASLDSFGPILDHVTVEDSRAYGMIVRMAASTDPTPPSLTNLTIRNSGRAPLRIAAAAVGGLGDGNTFQNNKPNRIQVTNDEVTNSIPTDAIYFDVRWRKQPVPYEILANIITRNGYQDKAYSIWTIDPGVKMLMHPDRKLVIGSNDSAQLLALGTEDEPIVIDRLNANSGNWRSIFFNPFSEVGSKLAYVQILNGGGTPGTDNGALDKRNDTPLELDHVTVQNSATAGLYANDGTVTINYGAFDSNDTGIIVDRALATIRNSSFMNNKKAGVQNNYSRICIDAAGNYWGAANGPADAGTSNTSCNDGERTNVGGGDAVSDAVIYWPWLSSADPANLTDRSSISSGDKLWILANGKDAAELTITVRDGDGNPVPGKQIELETTLGDLEQPAQPTNAEGQTFARITAKKKGDAYVTASNVTDGEQLAARLALAFWEGEGNAGGLIDPSGTPYLSPALVIEGEPFQVGFPVLFRLPMRNSGATPIDVEVEYKVSNFGVGNIWQPVTVISNTLQADQTWDAPGGFIPPDTVHRCVQYSMKWADAGLQGAQSMGSGSISGTRNVKKTKPPCEEPDATKLIPTGVGPIGVASHGANAVDQSNKVSKCISSQVNFQVQASADRDYTELVTPPNLSPPNLPADGDVSQAEADAMNAMAQTAADIAALNIALAETQARAFAASQGEAWNDAARQLEQYRLLQRERADKLEVYIDKIDALLQVLNEDPTYTAEDFAAYLAQLKSSGFPQETRQFHLDTGLNVAQIDAMLARTIDAMEQTTYVTVRFSDILQQLRSDARQEITGVRHFYPVRAIGGRSVTAAGARENLYPLAPIQEIFPVTNPQNQKATVDLIVRSGNLPVNWQTSLSETSLELEAGEAATVTLTINPGAAEALVDVDTYVGVEGYIDGEYIGGALFQQRLPVLKDDGPLYLPAIQG